MSLMENISFLPPELQGMIYRKWVQNRRISPSLKHGIIFAWAERQQRHIRNAVLFSGIDVAQKLLHAYIDDMISREDLYDEEKDHFMQKCSGLECLIGYLFILRNTPNQFISEIKIRVNVHRSSQRR